jgi:hypothetical protein
MYNGNIINTKTKIEMKRLILNTLIVGLAFGTSIAYAQTDGSAGATTDVKVNATKPLPPMGVRPIEKAAMMQAEKERVQGEKAEIKAGAKADIKDMRVDARNNMQEVKTQMRASTTARMMQMRQELKATTTARLIEARSRLQDAKVRMEEKRGEMMQKRVDNRFEKMNERFQATIERLGNIMSRVNARIEKIAAVGGDTTVAEKAVADASVLIETAKTGLVSMQTAGYSTVTLENSSSTRAEAKASLDGLVKAAKDLEKNLRDAQSSLEKAVMSLKVLPQAKVELQASTSAEVNTQN